MSEIAKCVICGEPLPPGEEVFKYHGYSGNCPKPPLPKTASKEPVAMVRTVTYEGIAKNDIVQEAIMLDKAPILPDGSYLYANLSAAVLPELPVLTDDILRYAMAAMGTGSPKDAMQFRLFWYFAAEAYRTAPQSRQKE